jgi:O-antigen/teichoic acid export membrane protein
MEPRTARSTRPVNDGAIPPRDADPTVPEAGHALDRSIVKNSLWVGLSFGGGQILSIAAVLVLARLLTPSEFGLVALATTLVTVLSHVQESGVGSALVHFREDPYTRASSALVFSSASGLALAIVVFLAAPLYASFVHTPGVTDIVRALSLLLVLRGLAVVPNAILERALDFKTRVKSELSSYVVQASVSVGCALAGLGAWSLVIGLISAAVVQTLTVWLLVPFRPSARHASWSTLRQMLRYGRFVSAANLLNLLNNSMDNLTVGRVLGSAAVGVYAMAWRLAELPATVVGPIVGRVMFSVYSHLQDDLRSVRRAYIQNMQRTVILGLAPTVALGLAADPIVPALLGPQWVAGETPLRILCVFGFIRLVAGPAGELFKGIGKPHLSLVGTVIFFVVGLTLLVVLVPLLELNGAALAMLGGSLVTVGFTIAILIRQLELPLREFGGALVRPIACSLPLTATILVLLPVVDNLSPGWALTVLIVAGVPVYLASLATIGRPVVAPVVAALRTAESV